MPHRQAAPPLVLLPGTLCDDRVFAPLLAALRQRLEPQPLDAEVIMSSAFDSMRGAAEHVLSVAPPSFALLGFSLGGILALEVALLAPGRVLGLGLLNVNAAPAPPDTHAARREAVLQAESIGHARYLQEQLWPIYVGPPSQGNMALQHLLACMANDLGHDAFEPQTEAALTRRDYRPLLSRLAMPTVVVAGEQDAICPVAGQRAIAEAMPNAQFTSIADAGHFALLEQQDAVAASVAAWFHTLSGNKPPSQQPFQEPSPATVSGDDVSQTEHDAASLDAASGDVHQVLQVERRDFTELVPTDRPQVQSMRGFDPIYTDIVDYIVRCTHKIWDERDVGLIYTHYTHNCVLYGVLGTMYDRESIVRETIQRIVELPDRRGMATSVIWRGNDVDGFYTSHMTHGTGRHTEYGIFGKPTGRTFVTRTIVDCMILENKIYREWVARDNMAQLVQLGIDPQSYAAALAQRKFEAGDAVVEIAENRRLLGQYPPEAEPDLSLAHTEVEAEVLRWLHHIYNKRMFGKIGEIYASNCQWHGPLMRELYGIGAVMQQTMRLVAMIPDCAFVPQHICSLPSEEGGTKIAVRWMMDGHHLGYGSLGPPTGHKLVVMGFTHLHLRDGKIVDEWVLYDELSMLVQLKLAALHKAA